MNKIKLKQRPKLKRHIKLNDMPLVKDLNKAKINNPNITNENDTVKQTKLCSIIGIVRVNELDIKDAESRTAKLLLS